MQGFHGCSLLPVKSSTNRRRSFRRPASDSPMPDSWERGRPARKRGPEVRHMAKRAGRPRSQVRTSAWFRLCRVGGFLNPIARRHGRTTWMHGVHARILRPRIRIARRHDVDTPDCCMNQSPDGRLAASPPRMKHRSGLPREPSCPRNSVVNSTSCQRLHARSVIPAHDGGHARARGPSCPRKRESTSIS